MTDFRLKVFVSVARSLSFTKASKELFISQPAISKHIQELESMYGVRLFNRKGSHITLTEAGKLLKLKSESIIEQYNQLAFEMHLLHNELVGELRLGASTTIAQYVLPPLLARFTERYPQVKISLFNGNSQEIEQSLFRNELDCGLVEGITRESNLKYTHFLRDELVVIVRDGHPLANKEELTMDEFRANGLVLRERGSGTLDVFEKALSRLNIKLSMLNVQLFLGSTESIKLYLEHTDAMGVVSIRSVAREVVLGRFKIIDVPALFMEREFSFIELHGEGNPLVEQFMRFAAKYKEKL